MSENKKNATEGTVSANATEGTVSANATEGTATAVKKDPRGMVKILLPKTRELRDDVFVSVNNYTCVIKRGEEVKVPYFVKEVLDHSEEMAAKRMAFEEKVQKK